MKGLAAAWLGLFLLFASVAHGNLESHDALLTMHGARALLLRGDSGLRRSDQAPEWSGEALIADHVARQWAAVVPIRDMGREGTNGLTYVWFPVGHLWLLVPAVAAGELLAKVFPGAEQRYLAARAPDATPEGQFVLHQAVVCLLPAAFAAASVLLLFAIARALGCSVRDAAIAAGAVAFASQFFPLGREALSDGPGMTFFLATLLCVVRAHTGTGTPTARLLPVLPLVVPLMGGACAGASVLVRYQAALAVPVFALAFAVAAWRRGSTRAAARDVAAFVLGGLPFLVLLLAVNHSRFGDVTVTGYPEAGTWFTDAPWIGLPKLLIAAGKGILWYSPMLWLALPLALRRANVPRLRWLAWVLFAIPVALFSCTPGWHSGQCWGARYVTPGVVALLAIVLPQTRPWVRWPRAFAVVAAVGVFANVTSVMAPARGRDQLAGQGVRALTMAMEARGELDPVTRAAMNKAAAETFYLLPRFSPLHANWTYAWRSASGGFEDERGVLRDGVELTIEPLFRVTSDDPAHGLVPVHWEDRGARHLWWRYWAAILGVPGWAALLAPLLCLGAGVALLASALRRVARCVAVRVKDGPEAAR